MSSQTGQEAEPEPEPEPKPQRKWVLLLPDPVLLEPGDDRDMLLEIDDPPRPSRLLLRPRFSRGSRGRSDTDDAASFSILAVAGDRSDRMLVQYSGGSSNRPIICICDTNASARSVDGLPAVPSLALGLELYLDRSIGLIAHPQSPTHFVVAQLHPAINVEAPNELLYYSTLTRSWAARQLGELQGPTRYLPREHGVISHDGRLWWLDLAQGLFWCDPLGIEPLRFLPLPADCDMGKGDYDAFHLNPATSTLLKQRRCVTASEGKLRFVEINGLSYDDEVPQHDPTVKIWTLVDPEGRRGHPWKLDYEVPFAEIWENKSYAEAGLPLRKVPHVAFADPNDYGVVFFFHNSKLFALDVRKRQVLAYYSGYMTGGGRQRPMVCNVSPPTQMRMQHLFPEGTFVTVRSRPRQGDEHDLDRVLKAKNDWKTVEMVEMEPWITVVPQNVWRVDYVQCKGKTWLTLQSCVSGRYLAGRKSETNSSIAVLVDYEQADQEDHLWYFEVEGLVNNARHSSFTNSKYGSWPKTSAPKIWMLEVILSTRTPPPAPPRPACPPHLRPVPSSEYDEWLEWRYKTRMVIHYRADDEGNFNKASGNCFPFMGRSLCRLSVAVMRRQKLFLGPEMDNDLSWLRLGLELPWPENNDVLCVLPGKYGRLSPLFTDLPASVEELMIVVVPDGSQAVGALRYPCPENSEA